MAEQARSGFKGHQNYGQYAGSYVATIKDLSAHGRQTAGSQNFNQLQRYQSEMKMRAAVDSGDVNFDMGLVPDKYKPQMEEYILTRSREKAKYELQLERMREAGSMDDPMYQELRMKSAAISNELGPEGSLTKAWTAHNQGAADYAKDSFEGAVSIMSKSENLHALSALYSNELDLQIVDGGLNFGNDEMGYSPQDEFPNYFNADYTNATKIISQGEGLFKKGEKLSDVDKLQLSNNFQEVLRKGGVETVLSLAFDPLITPNESFLNYNDPKYQELVELVQSDDATMAGKAMEILKKDLTDSYLTNMSNQAESGFLQKNPINPGPPTGADAFANLPFMTNGKFDPKLFNEVPEGGDLATTLKTNQNKILNELNIIMDEVNFSGRSTPPYSISQVIPGQGDSEPMVSYLPSNATSGTKSRVIPLSRFMKMVNNKIA